MAFVNIACHEGLAPSKFQGRVKFGIEHVADYPLTLNVNAVLTDLQAQTRPMV
jgi:hypothetical protein